jgi:hypothetical protein
MEPEKTIVCKCENCGNEAEMTVKCEEVVAAPLKPPAIPRQEEQIKRTVVCTRCGNEADMIVDYAASAK